MTVADRIWLNIQKIHPTKKDMKTLELQRAVKFEYIRHPPWILGLYWYSLNARQYSRNGAVYITRIVSASSNEKTIGTSRMVAVNISEFLKMWSSSEEIDILKKQIYNYLLCARLQKQLENVTSSRTHIEDSNYLHLDIHSRYVLRMHVGWSQVHTCGMMILFAKPA